MIATIFVAILCSHRGAKAVKNRFKTNKRKYDDILEAVELILIFLSWTKQDTFWEVDDTQTPRKAHIALRIMMAGLMKLLPRVTGSKWNLTKVHELLHMIFDMLRFGSPSNTHSGTSEKNHKQFAVIPLQTAQFQRSTFDWQVANRLTDHLVIEKAYQRTHAHRIDPGRQHTDEEDNDSVTSNDSADSIENVPQEVLVDGMLDIVEPIKQSTCGSSHCFIEVHTKRLEAGGYDSCFSEHWKTKASSNLHMEPDLLQFIFKRLDLHKTVGKHDLHIITEYRRDDEKYRSHPNYRKKGPWKDWVNVRWASDDENEDDYYTPSQIQCFFYHTSSDDPTALHVVLHACSNSRENCSILTYKWELEHEYEIVDADSLQDHVCIFPYREGDTRVLQLVPRNLWPDLFVNEEIELDDDPANDDQYHVDYTHEHDDSSDETNNEMEDNESLLSSDNSNDGSLSGTESDGNEEDNQSGSDDG